MLLTDKVAIVTGGASGIGEATCRLFAKEGAKVIVADYNFDAALKVSGEIDGFACFVNVAERNSIDQMVEQVINEFGKIDILINNAGITKDSTLLKMTQEQWNQVIAVNQTGVFDCTQAVAKHMIEKGYGRIVNTSSIVGRFGNFGQANYAASKAAVIALTQTCAKELGRKGINVNAVAPGFISTPMTKAMPPEVLKKMEDMVPLKRLGEAEDIAHTYLYLVSDYGKYINGAVIPVDGGLVI